MEEAYATAGVAILCLVSEPGEAIRHLESEAALRSVLQRRSVVLGYVVSSLAKKLREGERRSEAAVLGARNVVMLPHVHAAVEPGGLPAEAAALSACLTHYLSVRAGTPVSQIQHT